MGELIDHGATGFLVHDVDGATRATDLARHVDRSAIRATTVKRFDVSAMVEQYVAVYRSVLAEHG